MKTWKAHKNLLFLSSISVSCVSYSTLNQPPTTFLSSPWIIPNTHFIFLKNKINEELYRHSVIVFGFICFFGLNLFSVTIATVFLFSLVFSQQLK